MKKLLGIAGIAALMLAFTPLAQAMPYHHHHYYHHHHRHWHHR